MSGRRRGTVVGVFVQKEENSDLYYFLERSSFHSLTYRMKLWGNVGKYRIFASLLNPFSAHVVTDDGQSKRGERVLWENPRK